MISNPHEVCRQYFDEHVTEVEARLHGLLGSADLTKDAVVLIPYLEVVEQFQRLQPDGRGDRDFQIGRLPLWELFRNLLRSLQRLGASLRDYRRSLDLEDEADIKDVEDRRCIVLSPIDVSIDCDSCIVYARMLADYVAKTIPPLVMDPPYRAVGRSSFRDLVKFATADPSTPIGTLIAKRPTEWFDILARHVKPDDPDSLPGVRDARIHRGAVNSLGAAALAPGANFPTDWKVTMNQSSWDGLNSTDLIGDLAKVVDGLFSFLDDVTRASLVRHPALLGQAVEWSERNAYLVLAPSNFLKHLIPKLA